MLTRNKPRILQIGDLDLVTNPNQSQFQSIFTLINFPIPRTRSEVLESLQINEEFHNVDGIYAGWPAGGAIGQFDRELLCLLKRHSPDLRIITTCAVGFDSFDLQVLKSLGICLCNTPSHFGADDVADVALWHTLESFRFLSKFSQCANEVPDTIKTRRKLENSKSKYPFGHIFKDAKVHSPRGHNVGIVGFGKIGQAVGKRLSSIGMKVFYHARHDICSKSMLGFTCTYKPTLQDLISDCDLIILCVPCTKDTIHLINDESLSYARSGVKIINVGRGPLIDQECILNALDSGKIGFLGLDVFYKEPEIDHRLINRGNVSITPHVGSSTEEVFNNAALFCLNNLKSLLVDHVEESVDPVEVLQNVVV